MADELKLLTDWPGFPAGTIITANQDGQFWDASHTLWISPEFVSENPTLFQDPWRPAAGDSYWYVTDQAAIAQSTFDGSPGQSARIAAGNFYRTQDAAQAALLALMDTLTFTS